MQQKKLGRSLFRKGTPKFSPQYLPKKASAPLPTRSVARSRTCIRHLSTDSERHTSATHATKTSWGSPKFVCSKSGQFGKGVKRLSCSGQQTLRMFASLHSEASILRRTMIFL